MYFSHHRQHDILTEIAPEVTSHLLVEVLQQPPYYITGIRVMILITRDEELYFDYAELVFLGRLGIHFVGRAAAELF